jgi:hypothetical protein
MAGILNNILLGPGNVSLDEKLGAFYQDISPSLAHISNGIFADLDADGIPYCISQGERKYYPIAIIQYGLMIYDLYIKNIEAEENKSKFLKIVSFIYEAKSEFKNSFIWKNEPRVQYNLGEDWISGMVQGQAISLFCRAYQLTSEKQYLDIANKVFNSFFIEFEDGGFKRKDDNGFTWYEEYPTEKPSFVLNGFIYAIWGVLDLYRVTKNKEAKSIWDDSVKTLKANLHKYDVWYWSIYDQSKKQLVSYYYQKNVHIPLMQIMYGLTNEPIFAKYGKKWEKNLKNPLHRLITKIMYRIRPKIIKSN